MPERTVTFETEIMVPVEVTATIVPASPSMGALRDAYIESICVASIAGVPTIIDIPGSEVDRLVEEALEH